MSRFKEEIALAVKKFLFEPEVNINKADITTGRMFWVMNTTDAGYIDFVKRHPNYEDNVAAVYNTIKLAYAAMVTNRNDVTMLASHGGHAVAAMLDISKNRCHFKSIEVQTGRHYGSRSRITMGVTTDATDIAVIKNTGIGNTFEGLKFDSSNTKAESLYSFAEGGEYAFFTNCEFYKSTDLDVAGAAELLMNGDSSKFKDCTFGSLANVVSANGARPCVLTTRETITGKVCRDGMFENCLFWRNVSDVDVRFVYGANANDVERQLLFKDCTFVNAKSSTQSMAQAISSGSALTVGVILCKNCTSYNCTAFSTTTGVFVDNPAADAAGPELVQAA